MDSLSIDANQLLTGALLMSAFSSLLYFGISTRRYHRQSDLLSSGTLESRFASITTALTLVSESLKLIEVKLDGRKALANRLQQDASNAHQLAALSDEQRKAVQGLVRGELQSEGKKSLFGRSVWERCGSFWALSLPCWSPSLDCGGPKTIITESSSDRYPRG